MEIDAVLPAWLSTLANKATRRTYKDQVLGYLGWCRDEGVPPLDNDPTVINQHLQAVVDTRGERRAALRLYALRSFHDYLVGQEFLDTNATRDPKIISLRNPYGGKEVGPARTLSVDEMKALLQAARDRGPRYVAAVGLLGVNALKVGEVSAAKIEDRTDRHGKPGLHIPDRVIGNWTPLLSPTREALDELAEDRHVGPLVPNHIGNAVTRSNLGDWLRTLADLAGVDPIPTPRTLRSTAAAIAHSKGIHTGGLKELLGRTSTYRLERYHVSRPSAYGRSHPAAVIARAYSSQGHLEAAVTVLEEAAGPPALAVMQAAAALEERLRALLLSVQPKFDAKSKGTLTAYSGRLIHHGLIGPEVGKQIDGIAVERDLACHGWFDKFDLEGADQFIAKVRAVLAALPSNAD